jgi:hydroxymethylglutaryl-CoA synthase
MFISKIEHFDFAPPPCSKTPGELIGKRVVMFSYGSGLASCMYSLKVADSPQLSQLTQTLIDIPKTLAARKTIPPADFEATMKLREETHHLAPYKPVGDPAQLFPGTYYLTGVDDKHRRSYVRVAPVAAGSSVKRVGAELKSPLALAQQTLSNGTV